MTDSVLDVLVVGAGPVGLFCAHELTRAGLTCRIIDQKAGLSDKSKALGIHIRTLDVLADSGLLDEVLAQGHPVQGVLFKFKDKPLMTVTFEGIEANRHVIIDLPQDKTERIISNSLARQKMDVEWLTTLTNVHQTDHGVQATVTKPDGSTEQVSSRWLVACDGAHSTLRHLLEIPFQGDAYPQNWWLADVAIDWKMPDDFMVVYPSEKGPLACFPMGKGRYRVVMTANADQAGCPTLDDIAQGFRERSSDEATLSNAIWVTNFFVHHRQIQSYRRGHVFFAGDAAHIHSPMGGQGLNTGIQDIYNLVWKLALVKKGLAHETLLNSYHEERFSVGQSVLKQTDKMTRMMLVTNPFFIGLRNRLMSWFMSSSEIKNKVAAEVAEIAISYQSSPIVKKIGRATRFKRGFFLPDFTLQKSQKKQKLPLNRIVQGTTHHLFLFCGETRDTKALMADACELAANYHELLQVHLVLVKDEKKDEASGVTVWVDDGRQVHQHYRIKQPSAVLLRPDKYIGYCQSPFVLADFKSYLSGLLS